MCISRVFSFSKKIFSKSCRLRDECQNNFHEFRSLQNKQEFPIKKKTDLSLFPHNAIVMLNMSGNSLQYCSFNVPCSKSYNRPSALASDSAIF